MKKSITTTDAPLLQQQDALEMYFNALLSEVDDPDQLVPNEHCKKPSEIAAQEQPELSITVPLETPIEFPVKKVIELATEDSNLEATETNDFINRRATLSEPECLIETLDESNLSIISSVELVPKWARSLFQVISFSLGESLCTASINEVAGIIPTPTNLTYLPGQPPWFMGIHQYKGSTVNVFDLALIIGQSVVKMETRSAVNLPKGFIVLIGSARWGFVIRSMGNLTMLDNSDVKWKSQREHSDVVVGTVAKDMSTLLDLNVVLKYLSE